MLHLSRGDGQRRYGSVYANLQPRVTKALFDALQGDKPLATQYGAIVAVARLGPLCVHLLLLPVMPQLCARFEAALSPPSLSEQAETSPSGASASASNAAGTKSGSKAGSSSSKAGSSGKGKGKRLREASLVDEAQRAGRARVAALTEAHEARACLTALTAAVAVYLESLGLASVSARPNARAPVDATGNAKLAAAAKPVGRGKSKAAATAVAPQPAAAGSAEAAPGQQQQQGDDVACRHGPAKRAKRQKVEQTSTSEATSEVVAGGKESPSTSGGVGDGVVEALGESLVPFYARLHTSAAAELLV